MGHDNDENKDLERLGFGILKIRPWEGWTLGKLGLWKVGTWEGWALERLGFGKASQWLFQAKTVPREALDKT